MSKRYKYKFVRLATTNNWLLGEVLDRGALEKYREAIEEHAAAGWRLVQIFAPGISTYGAPAYYELILEREINPRVEEHVTDLSSRAAISEIPFENDR